MTELHVEGELTEGAQLAEGQIPARVDLDPCFELPEDTDPKFRTMYETLVTNFRRDLTNLVGKQPTTLQILVMERTAYNYALLKQKEVVAIGVDGGFKHMTEVKEFNAFWMGLAEQLNKISQTSPSEYRENLHLLVQTALGRVIGEIVSPEAASLAVRRFNEVMAETGSRK